MKDIKKETRKTRWEILMEEWEWEKQKWQKKQAENVNWLITHGTAEEVIREYSIRKNFFC